MLDLWYNICGGQSPTIHPEMGRAPGIGLGKHTPGARKEATEMATQSDCNTLLQHVATQRELRETRAAQGWYLYALGTVHAESVCIIAPVVADPKTGVVAQAQYVVCRETGRCSCPDQNRLDRVNGQAIEAGLQIDPLICKHALMVPLLLNRAEEEAERVRLLEAAKAAVAVPPAPQVRISPRAQWHLSRRRVRIPAGASL